LLAAFAIVLFPVLLSSQQISDQELRFDTQPYTPPATLHVQRNVVQIDVVVKDAKAQPVAGLTQQDFKVYDKGKEQAISQFTIESAPPKIVAAPAAASAAAPGNVPPSQTTAAANQQRFIALFFDDRNTPFSDLLYAQQAAEKFVQQNLHQGDKVGIFTASRSPILEFTNDTKKLLQTIESVRLQTLGPPPSQPNPCTQYPLGPYESYLLIDQGDTEVYRLFSCGEVPTPQEQSGLDTQARMILSSTNVVSKSSLDSLDSTVARLARMPGSRILVLTSSGFFTASLQPLIDVVTSDALDAGVVINSLDAKGLMARAPGGDAKDTKIFTGYGEMPGDLLNYENLIMNKQRQEMDDIMVSLARDTGGIFFHNNNDLDLGLREMAEVPEVSYRLGFSPSNLKPDGKFHDLKVKLAVPGSFEIQARRGYFAPTEAAAKAEGEADMFNNEVMKTNEISAIPAEIGAQAGRLAAGGTGFQISLRVDPKSLSFQKDHGRHLDKLNLITALFSNDGKFVTGEMGVVNMALTNKTLDDLSQRGLNATVVLNTSEGNYRLRVVLEDAGSGKMFATTRSLSIP
jgi:VWFA-related protein